MTFVMVRRMFFSRLFTNLLLVFTCVLKSDATLPSRFRNRHEYQPSADLEMIQNLDDKMYGELMNELPILRQILSGDRKKKTLRLNTSALSYALDGGGYDRVRSSLGTPRRYPATVSNLANSSAVARQRFALRTRWEARGPAPTWSTWFAGSMTAHWILNYPWVISCYWCGMNETLLPISSLCHDMFDSENSEARTLARFFRGRCYYYDKYRYYDRQFKTYAFFPPFHKWEFDVGLTMQYYGPYMDGCFKRFVDVGPLYTARGCRGRFLPWRSYERNFASHRLFRLETVARGHADVCVHSPYASLTPFSRAISLFVRYHVCVCDTSYCNAAPPATDAVFATLLVLLLVNLSMGSTCNGIKVY